MDEWASAPTIDEVKAFRDQLLTLWASGDDDVEGLDTQQAAGEKLYFQQFEVTRSEDRKPVKTGSAPADADAAVDSIVPTDVLIKVKPARAKKKYQDKAEKIARFGKALLHAWRYGKDHIRTVANDMTIRHVGVARVLADDQKWPILPPELQADDADPEEIEDWEAKNRRECPIVMEPRNPRYTRWLEDDRGRMLVVVEHYPSQVLEIRQALGQWPKAKKILRSRKPDEVLWVDDIWIGPYRCILIEEDPIFPGRGVLPHGYAQIPYAIAAFRELSNFANPGQKYRGIYSNGADLYPTESEALTAHMEMLFWNAYRTWMGWFVDGRDLKVVPGQYINVARHRNEYLEMMRGEAVAPELMQTAGVIDSYIQRNSTSQGPRSADGTRSGQQVWAIQSSRQIKLESPKQSMGRFIVRCLELGAMIAENNLRGEALTLPVPGRDREGNDLGEVTIRPKDIDGYWNGFVVIFDRRLDPAMIEQAKAVMGFSQNKWMPRRVSWELSGLTDAPQEWEDDLLEEAIDSTDMMIELAVLKRAENYFGKDSEEYALVFNNIAQSKQGGGQGIQPMGPGVPPGGSMQIASPRGPTDNPSIGSMARTNSAGGGPNNTPTAAPQPEGEM